MRSIESIIQDYGKTTKRLKKECIKAWDEAIKVRHLEGKIKTRDNGTKGILKIETETSGCSPWIQFWPLTKRGIVAAKMSYKYLIRNEKDLDQFLPIFAPDDQSAVNEPEVQTEGKDTGKGNNVSKKPYHQYDTYSATYGPNTKQWWIYDEEHDTYIDPPLEVLNKIDENGDYSTADGMDAMRDKLEDMCNKERPSWLFDKDYIYDSDIEI